MNTNYSEEGNITLSMFNEADNFTDWMYETIKPYLGGNILEIGSGLGAYSQRVIRDFSKDGKIVLSDIDEDYVKTLEDKFSGPNISLYRIDLGNAHDFEKINIATNSVLALNVLEHVEDDVQALNNVYKKLDRNGRLVLLVPAHKFLYNNIDKALGHFRRYSRKDILEKVACTDFKIERLSYFNFFSIPGWYLNGNILGGKLLSKNAVKIFDKLVPAFKFTEKHVLKGKVGISLVVVLRK